MNDWILIAIVAIWIPVTGCALTVLLFPNQHSVKAYWKAQNKKDEPEKDRSHHDIFV